MGYGGDRPVAALRRLLPAMPVMSRSGLKACLVRYIAYGWTGIVPAACRSMVLFVPLNVAPWLCGWPHRFVIRMRSVGSEVFVVGPYHGGDFSTGIDSAAELDRLPADFAGGILTNEIEFVAGALAAGGGSGSFARE